MECTEEIRKLRPVCVQHGDDGCAFGRCGAQIREQIRSRAFGKTRHGRSLAGPSRSMPPPTGRELHDKSGQLQDQADRPVWAQGQRVPILHMPWEIVDPAATHESRQSRGPTWLLLGSVVIATVSLLVATASVVLALVALSRTG